MIKLGLDTESLHLWLQNRQMDVFAFIEAAHEMGADGVMINLIHDFNLDPQWGVLGSNDPQHLQKVRELLQKHHMYAEFATRGLGYEHLSKVIRAADAVGADIIRTYIPITLNAAAERETGGDGKYDLGKVRLDFDPAVFDEAVVSLKAIVPVLKQYRIRIALENHEYETADELVDVIQKVDSPWIGLHYDFGNAMMAWEEPVEAARKMASYTLTLMSQWYFGFVGLNYIFNASVAEKFKYVFPCFCIIGAVLTIDLVWTLQDIALGMLTIPNLIAIVILSPQVKKATKEFFEREHVPE